MGNEYYKFSDKMSPEHNVKLAFTRMIAGQMDYTPGAFLNVTKEQFKQQTPAIVWNTRAAELSKFVIYESPLTVVCDHPDNILGQPGADFLKIVPTVWDDIKFISGYPGDYPTTIIVDPSGNDTYISTDSTKAGIGGAILGEEAPRQDAAPAAPREPGVLGWLAYWWDRIAALGRPLLLGMAIMATTTGLAAWLLVTWLWRLKVWWDWRRRGRR